MFLQIYLCGTTTIEPAGQEFPCLNGNRSKFKLSIQDIPNSINIRHIGSFFIIYRYFPIPLKQTENRVQYHNLPQSPPKTIKGEMFWHKDVQKTCLVLKIRTWPFHFICELFKASVTFASTWLKSVFNAYLMTVKLVRNLCTFIFYLNAIELAIYIFPYGEKGASFICLNHSYV